MARYSFELDPASEQPFREALDAMMAERSCTLEHLSENRCALGIRPESVDIALHRVSAELGVLGALHHALEPDDNLLDG